MNSLNIHLNGNTGMRILKLDKLVYGVSPAEKHQFKFRRCCKPQLFMNIRTKTMSMALNLGISYWCSLNLWAYPTLHRACTGNWNSITIKLYFETRLNAFILRFSKNLAFTSTSKLGKSENNERFTLVLTFNLFRHLWRFRGIFITSIFCYWIRVLFCTNCLR